MQRHASVLRRFWQTSSGFTLGDALIVGLFLAGAAGIAWAWRPRLQAVRQQERAAQAVAQAVGQPAQQLAQQRQQSVPGPSLPAAAAVAAAAAAGPS